MQCLPRSLRIAGLYCQLNVHSGLEIVRGAIERADHIIIGLAWVGFAVRPLIVLDGMLERRFEHSGFRVGQGLAKELEPIHPRNRIA